MDWSRGCSESEHVSYTESYAEKYGHTHVVKEFDLPWKSFWKSQINSIIDSFCGLYFEMISDLVDRPEQPSTTSFPIRTDRLRGRRCDRPGMVMISEEPRQNRHADPDHNRHCYGWGRPEIRRIIEAVEFVFIARLPVSQIIEFACVNCDHRGVDVIHEISPITSRSSVESSH
jgi:hypothetical protein